MKKEEKPFYVVFNKNKNPVVTIDRRIVSDSDSSKMVERFKKSGFEVKELTSNEYKKVNEVTKFQEI
ncbi:hypothetical protein [Bacillus sp. NPDC094106]|uniref:hypothetical protein n=1 Tax=Bacillus sp. NPDC094106 TaxID=3363949 RepID=UPI00382E6B4E